MDRHQPLQMMLRDRWLILIIVVGFALRLAWALPVEGSLLFGDSAWYVNVAKNLVHGQGFVANHNNPITEPPDVPQLTAYYPPLYPFVLAGWWRVVGIGSTSGEVLNVFLGTLAIPLVFMLGRSFVDRQVGLTSAAVYALVPNAIVWLPLLLSEALFTVLLLAALYVLVSGGQRLLATAAFGGLTGLATLTRGEGAVLVPAALAYWALLSGWRVSLRRSAVALAAAVLIILPWTVRNWVQLDSAVPIATSTGVNLRIGHSPEADGTFVFLNDPIDGVAGQDAQLSTDAEVRANRVYTKRAIVYALQHPIREVALSVQKVRYLFQSDDEMALQFELYGGTGIWPGALDRPFGPLVATSWYALLAASVLLAPLWMRRNATTALLAAVFILWIGFHIAFFAIPRYHLPLLPLIVIAAVAGANELKERVRATPASGRSAILESRRILEQ